MEKNLFAYLNEDSKRRLHTLLSQFTGRIVKQKHLNPTVEGYNQINRNEIVEAFLNCNGRTTSFLIHKYKYQTVSKYSENDFRQDLVQFVDLKIPLYYFQITMVKATDDWIRSKKNYKGIEMFPGLKFEYPQNYEREKNWIRHSVRCLVVKTEGIQEGVKEIKQEKVEIVIPPMVIGMRNRRVSTNQITKIKRLCGNLGCVLVDEQNLNYDKASIIIGILSRGVIHSPYFETRNDKETLKNVPLQHEKLGMLDKNSFETTLMTLEQKSLYFKDSLNKANLKNALIRPLIQALGYQMDDPREVYEDYQVADKTVDFALMHEEMPVFLVKIGGAKETLFSELSEPLKKAPSVRYLLHTDGINYSIYVVHPESGVTYLESARINSFTDNVSLLYSFAKKSLNENMDSDILKTLKNKVTRKVAIQHVKNLIKNPTQELIEVLKKQGVDSNSMVSIFHDAVNEFSSECRG
jgi:hypothetical protein